MIAVYVERVVMGYGSLEELVGGARRKRSVLIVSAAPATSGSDWIAGVFGAQVEVITELYTALEAVEVDPVNWSLVMIDCEGFGGLDEVTRAIARVACLGATVPVILSAMEVAEQSFPAEGPVVLRAPITRLSLRMGVEHALRRALAVNYC
ncbi:MAG: hypothetical protein KGH84_07360 [Paracoccaceae bacterium]|nr:hypothetical protein [Paracoccaceae bacterium]